MKHQVFLTMFFVSFLGLSQTKGGKAIYNVFLTIEKNAEGVSERLSKSLEEAEVFAENLELSLEFNDKKAVFKPKDNDGIELKGGKIALAWCGCGKTYYTDILNGVVLYNNEQNRSGIFKKNEFLVEKPINTKWIISQETKTIHNLKCYKAIQEIPDGNKIREITVWFAPEVPYPYGPNGYAGLPGLIIELQDGKTTLFGLKKLTLSDVFTKIELPTEGKRIKEEEYFEIMIQRRKKHMETLEK